jgi:single-strand DNA-binding protein
VNDTMVTVVGNVVDSPRRVSLQNGAVTNFRMASTARRYDTGQQAFVDAGTLWVDVECWNGLSSNVSASISKGDPVVVIGTLTTHSWESENGRRSAPRIKATAVGPNLARGTAVFKRDRPARAVEPAESVPTGPEPSEATVEAEFSGASEEFVAGRDYEMDEETLHHRDRDDLSSEPVHA